MPRNLFEEEKHSALRNAYRDLLKALRKLLQPRKARQLERAKRLENFTYNTTLEIEKGLEELINTYAQELREEFLNQLPDTFARDPVTKKIMGEDISGFVALAEVLLRRNLRLSIDERIKKRLIEMMLKNETAITPEEVQVVTDKYSK